MLIKIIPILMLFVFFTVQSEEECIFDEASYLEFIKKLSTGSKAARIEKDNRTLVVERNNEKVVIKGGGCVHLGSSINSESTQTYTEEKFLRKVLLLTKEFGVWLINISSLENSINNKKFQIIDGEYYIELNAMTVFSASYTNPGEIRIEFYIN